MPSKPGVYKLTNRINGKIYIGKSMDLQGRMRCHKSSKKQNQVIQRAIQKYGWENFETEVLQEYEIGIDNWILLALETAYIVFFESLVTQHGYNVCLFSNDRTGIKHTEEVKKKMSESSMGRIMSQETRRKLSDALKGEKSPYWGKKKPKEVVEKIRRANLGRKYSQEVKDRLSAIIKARITSPITASGKWDKKFDRRIYTFFNKNTKEIFVGIKFDFKQRFKLRLSFVFHLVKNKPKNSRSGWEIIEII